MVIRTVLGRESPIGLSLVSKHRRVAVKPLSFDGHEYALVLIDDITETIEARRSLEQRAFEFESHNRLLHEALENAAA